MNYWEKIYWKHVRRSIRQTGANRYGRREMFAVDELELFLNNRFTAFSREGIWEHVPMSPGDVFSRLQFAENLLAAGKRDDAQLVLMRAEDFLTVIKGRRLKIAVMCRFIKLWLLVLGQCSQQGYSEYDRILRLIMAVWEILKTGDSKEQFTRKYPNRLTPFSNEQIDKTFERRNFAEFIGLLGKDCYAADRLQELLDFEKDKERLEGLGDWRNNTVPDPEAGEDYWRTNIHRRLREEWVEHLIEIEDYAEAVDVLHRDTLELIPEPIVPDKDEIEELCRMEYDGDWLKTDGDCWQRETWRVLAVRLPLPAMPGCIEKLKSTSLGVKFVRSITRLFAWRSLASLDVAEAVELFSKHDYLVVGGCDIFEAWDQAFDASRMYSYKHFETWITRH